MSILNIQNLKNKKLGGCPHVCLLMHVNEATSCVSSLLKVELSGAADISSSSIDSMPWLVSSTGLPLKLNLFPIYLKFC